jgi:hypothetical protein
VEESYTGFVLLVDQAATWLRGHTFIAILILAVPSGAIVAMWNIGKDANLIVGRVANALASAASVIAALTVLLPFVVRGTTGIPPAILTIPACLKTDRSRCALEANAYLTQVSQQYVPYSDLLAVSTLCFFFAALIWYFAALRASLKP